MGADLIGYFAKGPKELDRSRTQAAQRRAVKVLDWAHEFLAACASGDHGGDPVVRDKLVGLLATSPYGLAADSDLDAVQFALDPLNPAPTRPERRDQARQRVGYLLDNWPHLGRDCSWIEDPDKPGQVIVFAGELSWGDHPCGQAFESLEHASLLGLDKALGLWIGRSFMSLIVPFNAEPTAPPTSQ